MEQKKGSIKSILNSRFVLFIAVATCMNVTNFMVNPTLTVAANQIGASASVIGVITSMMGLTSFLLMVIAGPASVSFAPHRLLAVGCFGYALSYLMLASNQIPLFIAAKAVEGFFAMFILPPSMLILRDCISFDQVNTAMGVFQMRNSFAKIVGPLLGMNLLVNLIGFQGNFLVSAVLFVIYGIVSLCCFKLKNTEFVPQPFRIKPQNIISKGGFLPMILVFFFCVCHMSLGYFNNVYASAELGLGNTSLFLSVGNLFAVVLGPIFASWADKVGEKKILIPAIIALGLSSYIWSISHTMLGCIIAASIEFTSFSTFASVMTAVLVKRAGASGSGVAGNTFGAGQNLGSFAGGLLAGQLVQAFGYRSMYRIMVAFPVLTLIVALIVFSQKRVDAAAEHSGA